jgi:hypothetical protein
MNRDVAIAAVPSTPHRTGSIAFLLAPKPARLAFFGEGTRPFLCVVAPQHALGSGIDTTHRRRKIGLDPALQKDLLRRLHRNRSALRRHARDLRGTSARGSAGGDLIDQAYSKCLAAVIRCPSAQPHRVLHRHLPRETLQRAAAERGQSTRGSGSQIPRVDASQGRMPPEFRAAARQRPLTAAITGFHR